MTTAGSKRKEERIAVDTEITLCVSTDGTNHRFIRGRAINVSKGGGRIHLPEPLDVGARAYLRADSCSLFGTAKVRYCQPRLDGFVVGLELEKRATSLRTPDEFIDYYEILQITPKADFETLHRVFRLHAARYHPDNQQTGDAERFKMLVRIYETLSDPKKRAEYDIRRQVREPVSLPVFGLAEFVAGIDGEVNRRLGVLCLLYKRRSSSPDHPGLSLLDLEFLMGFPREQLMFTVGYLQEKQFMRTVENSDFRITAEGMDALESGARGNKLFSTYSKRHFQASDLNID